MNCDMISMFLNVSCVDMCRVSISRCPGAGSTANARPLPAAGTGTTSVEDPAERYRCGAVR